MNNIVHVYGQESFHDDVWIVADREGMERLYSSMGEIINGSGGLQQSFETCVNDGEGYSIHVKFDNTINMGKYSVPYSADYACEKRKDAIYPWTKDTVK